MHLEDVEYGLNGGFRVKPLKSEFKLILLEELVVKKVVDEVQEELGLGLDLRVVFFGLLMLLLCEPQKKKQVDEDDDRAEGRAHFVGHVLVAVPHRLQFHLAFFIDPG